MLLEELIKRDPLRVETTVSGKLLEKLCELVLGHAFDPPFELAADGLEVRIYDELDTSRPPASDGGKYSVVLAVVFLEEEAVALWHYWGKWGGSATLYLVAPWAARRLAARLGELVLVKVREELHRLPDDVAKIGPYEAFKPDMRA